MSYRDVLNHIALSSPITFIIGGRKIRSGVLYKLKSDPKKMIMLCRYVGGDYYVYKIHTYKTNPIEEVDCTEFSNVSDMSGAINPDNLIYEKWANELVLEKAKQWITHLQSAEFDNV